MASHLFSNHILNNTLSSCSFQGTWSTLFSQTEETVIERNALLHTIPLLKKEWRVSLDFKANSKISSLVQVFHMTKGGKGTGSGSKYGDRTPALWIHNTRGMLVSSGVGGKVSYAKYYKPVPTPGQWVNIVIGQELVGSAMKYFISIDGKEKLSVTNSKPAEFENVKVFASTNWYTPMDGAIKNLLIETKLDGRCLIETILTLIRLFNSVDCEVQYGAWSDCSVTCENGTETRNGSVTVPQQNQGAECPPLSETRPCSRGPCPGEIISSFKPHNP